MAKTSIPSPIKSIKFKKISEKAFYKHKMISMPKNDIEALILALKDYKDEELFEIEESGLILRGIRPKEKDKEYDTVAFYTYADYPYLASNMVFKTKEGKYIVERNTDPGGEDTMKYFELTIK